MNTSLILSMFAAISVGLIAAGTALAVGWGWLIAIALYCACGTLALVVCAVVAVVIALRPPRHMDMPVSSTPGSSLILVSP